MDMADYLRFAAALGVVLALILGLAAIVRRLGLAPLTQSAKGAPRLSVSEVKRLDARNALVLVKRDGVEHLIVLGPEGAHTIETGIVPAIPAPAERPAIWPANAIAMPWPRRTAAPATRVEQRA